MSAHTSLLEKAQGARVHRARHHPSLADWRPCVDNERSRTSGLGFLNQASFCSSLSFSCSLPLSFLPSLLAHRRDAADRGRGCWGVNSPRRQPAPRAVRGHPPTTRAAAASRPAGSRSCKVPSAHDVLNAGKNVDLPARPAIPLMLEHKRVDAQQARTLACVAKNSELAPRPCLWRAHRVWRVAHHSRRDGHVQGDLRGMPC